MKNEKREDKKANLPFTTAESIPQLSDMFPNTALCIQQLYLYAKLVEQVYLSKTKKAGKIAGCYKVRYRRNYIFSWLIQQ